MKWIELLRRQLPLADFDEIFLAENWCPAAFFGVAAPSLNTGKCGEPEVCLKHMCWTKDVPPEVLAAHGIKEPCQHEWGDIDYCPAHDYGDNEYPATECLYCRVRCMKCGLETSAFGSLVCGEEADRGE